MAERREELDAYVFARRRMVAAFLRGCGAASDLDAPRPVRTFMVGLVLGGLLLAGYGLWGLATHDTPPQGWEQAIVVDRETGSRYIKDDRGDDRNRFLHPVLNLCCSRCRNS